MAGPRRLRVPCAAVRATLLALSSLLAACGSAPASAGFTIEAGASASPTAAGSPSAAPTGRPRPSAPAADVGIKVIAGGLPAPDGLVGAPDGRGRLFVIDQTGKVFIIQDGAVLPQPFLDVSAKLPALDPSYDERGLLGLAFDPKFGQTGRVFIYYTARLRKGAPAGQDHTDVVSSFRVSPADPNVVDPASEQTILQFEQPQANHNGGGLGFGPDGDLYIGVGDGGSEGDIGPGHSAGGNGQDLTKLNGKILRIDVGGAAPYTIPPDNPYAHGGGRPEIYADGLRNPWRFSWEPAGQHRLISVDVGWGRYEEVDVVVAGGDYGWPIREGAHCLDVKAPLADVASCASADKQGRPLLDPVFEYSHADVGIAIVGGDIYQGSTIPALAGRYVFADLSRNWTTTTPVGRGSLLAATPLAGPGTWAWQKLTIQGDPPLGFVAGLGEDGGGELYLLTRDQLGATDDTGQVLEVVPGG
jgi:glucose/arabinose dehydrogenase